MSCIPGLLFRPALLELVALAEAEPDSDEAHFLGQLRAAIAGLSGEMESRMPRRREKRPELRLVHSAE